MIRVPELVGAFIGGAFVVALAIAIMVMLGSR